MALSISTDSSISGQTNTQSPQIAGQPAASNTKSGSLQPGTATSLLTSPQGVPLYATALPSVSLNTPAPLPATSTSSVTQTPQHHVNHMLFGLPVLLIVVAVILLWVTKRSVKSTTE